MKESEFIELLNLYLDHEISPADAVRLEAEVQNNPARRRVYQQYCRMQKACKLLTTDFQTEPATTTADQKVIAFNPAVAEAQSAHRRRMGVVYTFGTLATAACVALIFTHRADRSAPAGSAPVAQVSAPAAAPQATEVAVTTSGPQQLGVRNRQSPKLVTDPLLLSSNAATAQAVAAAGPDANEHLKWIASLQIAPLPQHVPAEELRFDVRPATLRPEARVLGGTRVPTETNVEMTAFRFVK